MRVHDRLSEAGITKDQFEDISKLTLTDPWSQYNAIPLKEPKQVYDILVLAA